MSMHEWNAELYGIKVEHGSPTGERALVFVKNHEATLCEMLELEPDELPQTPEEAREWIDEYFDEHENEQGAHALIADLAGKYIDTTTDSNSDMFIGLFAHIDFPWDERDPEWQALTPEDIENSIRPLYEELYGKGTCPKFEGHTAWYFG